ncbi:hypothetical protein C8R45DRAFT_921906 [Mycena sanguinolenta]|nr:hypothetical protein C8R45DRAFT_921906 [Mycena sanguinolenta]
MLRGHPIVLVFSLLCFTPALAPAADSTSAGATRTSSPGVRRPPQQREKKSREPMRSGTSARADRDPPIQTLSQLRMCEQSRGARHTIRSDILILVSDQPAPTSQFGNHVVSQIDTVSRCFLNFPRVRRLLVEPSPPHEWYPVSWLARIERLDHKEGIGCARQMPAPSMLLGSNAHPAAHHFLVSSFQFTRRLDVSVAYVEYCSNSVQSLAGIATSVSQNLPLLLLSLAFFSLLLVVATGSICNPLPPTAAEPCTYPATGERRGACQRISKITSVFRSNLAPSSSLRDVLSILLNRIRIGLNTDLRFCDFVRPRLSRTQQWMREKTGIPVIVAAEIIPSDPIKSTPPHGRRTNESMAQDDAERIFRPAPPAKFARVAPGNKTLTARNKKYVHPKRLGFEEFLLLFSLNRKSTLETPRRCLGIYRRPGAYPLFRNVPNCTCLIPGLRTPIEPCHFAPSVAPIGEGAKYRIDGDKKRNQQERRSNQEEGGLVVDDLG